MTRAAVGPIGDTLAPARGQAWHGGPTPVGAVRGVSAAAAHWTPAPGRASIWGLTLYIAYWKYTIRRHLVRRLIPRFPRHPANFPVVPRRADEALWKADRALLAAEHRLLAEAIAAFSPGKLGHIPVVGKRWPFGQMLIGVAMHDAYHTGQIQLLKRLWDSRR
ncbi:MAG: DinB family protein [Gemmatimonadetes bacterium]|nr:DinB family protein [Gemmatimonadota bacterium]